MVRLRKCSTILATKQSTPPLSTLNSIYSSCYYSFFTDIKINSLLRQAKKSNLYTHEFEIEFAWGSVALPQIIF